MDRETISLKQLKGIPLHDFCQIYLAGFAKNLLVGKQEGEIIIRKFFFILPFL